MARSKAPGGRNRGKQSGASAQVVEATAGETTAAPRRKTSPAQFFSQVRAEARKITWPSRKETWVTSVMVFIMVALAALFFWVVDLILSAGFQQIISFGR